MTFKLSPILAIKEAMRRLFGIRYRFNGIEVSTRPHFLLVQRSLMQDIKLYREGEFVVAQTAYGVIKAPSFDMLHYTVMEIPEIYRDLDPRNKRVMDIGAFIGETSVYFASSGASEVHAFEPIYYELVELNARANGFEKTIRVYPYGVYYERRKICVLPELGKTGRLPGPKCFDTIPLEEAIKHISPDIVKMDCEGCEISILFTKCSTLRLVREWIIEIHGCWFPIIDKLQGCGFKYKSVYEDACALIAYFYQ